MTVNRVSVKVAPREGAGSRIDLPKIEQLLYRAWAATNNGGGSRGRASEALLLRAVSLLHGHSTKESSVLMVRALRQLGDCNRAASRFREARERLRQALHLSERVLGKQHLETAHVLNSLGILCKYSGDYGEASRAYRRALRIARLGHDRYFVATLYHNLGGLFHEQRRYTKAAPFARRSVYVREALLGANHPDVIADKAAYAAILHGQRRFRQALHVYLHVLKYFEHRQDNYEIAVTANNLGGLYFALKQPELAKRHLRRSVRLKRKILGADHWDYAFTLCNLGVLHRKQGQPNEAKKLLTEAYGILSRHLGPKHPHVRRCGKNLIGLRSC